MAVSMLELFRTLTSFSPPRTELKHAPWDAFVPWAIGQGLASLCAYNLEYRLGSAGSPEWANLRGQAAEWPVRCSPERIQRVVELA